MSDIGIEKSGHVALIEIRRPPNNFFDIPLIKELAGAFESFDEDIHIRAVVLAAQGKAFCAGANFSDGSTLDAQGRRPNEPVQVSRHFMSRATGCFAPKSRLSRRYMGQLSVVASGLRWWPTSAWPVRRRASAPTSRASVFTPASVLPSRCRR